MSEDLTGPVAALNLPRRNGPLLMFAQNVHDALKISLYFLDPYPSLPAFQSHIDEYRDAETKAATRGKGLARARNAKRKKVKEDLHHLRDYVQSVAELQSSPADAAAVIASACMSIRKVGKRSKAELAALDTGLPGVV